MEKTLGFTIEVRGSDEQNRKMADLKRQALDLTREIDKIKEATRGNIGAQKASAEQMAKLEATLKAVRGEYTRTQTEVISMSQKINSASGSYNALTEENKNLVAQYRTLSPLIPEQAVQMGELSKKINANTQSLIAMDATMGRHQRNVGNYTGALVKVTDGFKGIGGILQSVTRGMGLQIDVVDKLATVGDALFRNSKDVRDITEALDLVGRKSTAGKVAQTAATESLTVAERILNAVRSVSVPLIGVLAGAMIGLALAYFEYKEELFGISDAEKERRTALDGLIIANDELRESHNKHIHQMRDLQIEYDLTTGKITEYEAAVRKLRNKNDEAVEGIRTETKKKLEETRGFWEQTKNFILSGGNSALATARVATQQAEILKDANLKMRDQQQKDTEEWGIEYAKMVRKLFEEEKEKREKEAEDRQKLMEENRQKLLELSRKYIDNEIELTKVGAAKEKEIITVKYLREIEDLEAQIIKKKGLLTKAEEEINSKILEIIPQLRKRLIDDLNKIDESLKPIEVKLELVTEVDTAFNEKIKPKDKKGRELPDTILGQLFGMTDENAQLLSNKTLELFNNISDALFQAQQDRVDRMTAREIESLENRHSTEEELLKNQLDKNLISEAQFKERKDALDKSFEAKKREQERRAFEEHKRIAKKQVAIDLALELGKIAAMAAANPANAFTAGGAGLAQYAFLAAFASLAAGLRVATIDAQQFKEGGLPKKGERGMIVGGKPHSQGGTKYFGTDGSVFEAEKDELLAIMNKRSTAMFGGLSAMNVAGGGVPFFASGGLPVPNIIPFRQSGSGQAGMMNYDLLSDMIAAKLGAVVNGQKVYIIDKEMSDALNKAELTDSLNSF